MCSNSVTSARSPGIRISTGACGRMPAVKSLPLLRKPTGRRDSTRWMTALFAVAALLWQSVVPLLAPAPKAANDQVVICTAHGFQTVSLASLDGSDDSKSGQERSGKVECPLCSGGHAGAAYLPNGAHVEISGSKMEAFVPHFNNFLQGYPLT